MKYIAVTASGKHYWKLTVRPGRAFGARSWGATEDISEAHRFPSRKAAEKFLEGTPKGHSVLEVEK